jgi:hypothetical protein
MLLGFRKPIVLTGSQMPLASARTDARQNLIDALTCAVAGQTPPHVQARRRVRCVLLGVRAREGRCKDALLRSDGGMRQGCMHAGFVKYVGVLAAALRNATAVV